MLVESSLEWFRMLWFQDGLARVLGVLCIEDPGGFGWSLCRAQIYLWTWHAGVWSSDLRVAIGAWPHHTCWIPAFFVSFILAPVFRTLDIHSVNHYVVYQWLATWYTRVKPIQVHSICRNLPSGRAVNGLSAYHISVWETLGNHEELVGISPILVGY